ncbi:hypothetical protein BCVP_CDS0022 [Bacillus phage BC-VP]|nr:hypothetical protein BCVP_CDS0022 [Bacillus phage BC-VP]
MCRSLTKVVSNYYDIMEVHNYYYVVLYYI